MKHRPIALALGLTLLCVLPCPVANGGKVAFIAHALGSHVAGQSFYVVLIGAGKLCFQLFKVCVRQKDVLVFAILVTSLLGGGRRSRGIFSISILT